MVQGCAVDKQERMGRGENKNRSTYLALRASKDEGAFW